MVDLVFLPDSEVVVIDTSTAITTILLLFGSVKITSLSDNSEVANLSGDIEMITVPANSGKYSIQSSGNSKIAVVRMFYI
ncbi:MAG: hypothetical protein ACP5F0_04270 [Sulfurihydrogenibium sp.]